MESLPAHDAARLSALIAHLYDAAMDTALWSGTASRIAHALSSTSAVVKLHAEDDRVSLLECTPNLIAPERDQAWSEEWHRRDLWVERSLAFGMSRIITDEDLVTPEEQARSGFYQEWLQYLGIHHLVGAVFPTAQGAVGVFGIHRPRGAGAYTDQDRRRAALVLPHLQRALRLGQHLSTLTQQHAVALQALDRFDTGVLLVDGNCRVLQSSAMADALLRSNPEFTVVGGRFSLSLATLRDTLLSLVRAAMSTARNGTGKPGSVLLVPRHQRMPLTLEVAPLRPAALGAERPAVLVFIRDPEAPIAIARLRELFGFTRTEAAVASALARGQSLEEIGTAMHIGLGTVRTHLKRVLSKTGTHRQGQAVALLARSIATTAHH